MKRPRSSRSTRRVRRRPSAAPGRRMPRYRNMVAVKRTCVLGATSFTQTWSGTNWSFKLDALPNYTDFTAGFNAYRILAVKLLFMPVITGIDGEAGTTVRQVPRAYTAIDRSSNPQYATENGMLQYGNVRVVRSPLRMFSVYIKSPAVWEGVATSASVAYSEPKGRQWISCDTPSIPHYGCVVGGICAAGTAGVSYNIVATYYLQFKDAR